MFNAANTQKTTFFARFAKLDSSVICNKCGMCLCCLVQMITYKLGILASLSSRFYGLIIKLESIRV